MLNAQVGPGDPYLALTDAEKAADPDHDAVDVAIGANVDRRDLPDRFVLGIVDLAANQLARVGCRGGRRRGGGGRPPRTQGGALPGPGAGSRAAGQRGREAEVLWDRPHP